MDIWDSKTFVSNLLMDILGFWSISDKKKTIGVYQQLFLYVIRNNVGCHYFVGDYLRIFEVVLVMKITNWLFVAI